MAKENSKKNNKVVTSRQRPEKEFDQKMVDLARVTRVMKGGKRMSFRALVVIGDKKGRVGFGLEKGADVQIAMNKAVRAAEKSMIKVPLTDENSIPHELKYKFKSAKILLKPAKAGTGVKAGGALRNVLTLTGIENIVGKQLGASSKINNVKAAFKALGALKDTSNPPTSSDSSASGRRGKKQDTEKSQIASNKLSPPSGTPIMGQTENNDRNSDDQSK